MKVNHPNLGEVVDTLLLEGIITAVYSTDDTCDLTVNGVSQLKVPLFYHCTDDAELRSNGALYGGSAAFKVGDIVITQMEALTSISMLAKRVLGFKDGLIPCGCSMCEEVGALKMADTELYPVRKLNLALTGGDITWVWQGADSYPNSYPNVIVSYNEEGKFILMSLPAGSYNTPFDFGFEFQAFGSIGVDNLLTCCIDYEHEIHFGGFGGSPWEGNGDILLSASFKGEYVNSYVYNTFNRGIKFVNSLEVPPPFADCGPVNVKREVCQLDQTSWFWSPPTRLYTFILAASTYNYVDPAFSITTDSWIKIKGISVYLAQPTSVVSDYYRGVLNPNGQRNCYCDAV